MADSNSVAVIIVTYNSKDEIGPCLASLVGHIHPFEATITVVDNASTDGTAAFVREQFPSVNVIDAGGNLGFSKANNIGIRATTGDFVLVLNPDTVAPPGGVQALLRGLASHQDTAIAGPRLLNERGFPELSWADAVSPWSDVKRKILVTLYYRKVRRVVRKIDRLSRQSRDVLWVSGACMAIRRSDLNAIGMFDERYFMYTEDVDLCLAMRKAGRAILYIAQAEILHYRGRSAGRNPNTEKMRRKSQLAFYEKHHRMWAPFFKMYLQVTRQPYGN